MPSGARPTVLLVSGLLAVVLSTGSTEAVQARQGQVGGEPVAVAGAAGPSDAAVPDATADSGCGPGAVCRVWVDLSASTTHSGGMP